MVGDEATLTCPVPMPSDGVTSESTSVLDFSSLVHLRAPELPIGESSVTDTGILGNYMPTYVAHPPTGSRYWDGKHWFVFHKLSTDP